tara:strand:+ start:1249 stop:1845 length:597 start_codon:yes stop_codon:yes gene_type:complete
MLVFIIFFIQINLFAQEVNNTQTLFGSTKPINTTNIGYFIAASYGLTQMDENTASIFNLRGGVSIKDKLSFGAYFSTSLNEINPQSETVPNVYMDYHSFGGFAEYTILSKKIIHLTFPLFIGYGEVQMDNESGNAGLGESNFFQIEPSAMLEVNLYKSLRFNIGTGYRFIENMNYRNFDQSDISGFTGYIGLKLGVFK